MQSGSLLWTLLLYGLAVSLALVPCTTMKKRRSLRLLGQSPEHDDRLEPISKRSPSGTKTATTKKPQSKQPNKPKGTTLSLPRTIEKRILSAKENDIQFVIGVDEAGRGPLAGPVVAAAVLGTSCLEGLCDSKQTPEHVRESLYEQLILQDSYAICVVDNETIDEINILQATLLAMKSAVAALISGACDLPIRDTIDIQHSGCRTVLCPGRWQSFAGSTVRRKSHHQG